MAEESPRYVESVGKVAHARNQQVEPYVGWTIFGEEDDRFAVEIGSATNVPGVFGLGGRVLHSGEVVRIRYDPPVSFPFIHPDKGAIIYNRIVEVEGTVDLDRGMQLRAAKVTCADQDTRLSFDVHDAPLRYRRRDSVEFLLDKSIFGDRIYLDSEYAPKLRTLVTDFTDVWDEVLAYVSRHPEYLQEMHWRKFEELLAIVFRRKGFDVELGPGRSDGGVDLRLLYKDPVGPLVTLVQAKRWAQHRKIPIEPVRAFYSVVQDESANRGLFVSTSEFLPECRRFAESKALRLDLAGPEAIMNWIRSVLGKTL